MTSKMKTDRESDESWLYSFEAQLTKKEELKMSRITVAYPFEAIQGKVNKQDSAYFCKRNGKTYLNRVVNTNTSSPTEAQLNMQTLFSTCTKNTNAIMADTSGEDYAAYKAAWQSNSSGYTTLRGYVFAKEYAKLQ